MLKEYSLRCPKLDLCVVIGDMFLATFLADLQTVSLRSAFLRSLAWKHMRDPGRPHTL